MLVFAPLHAVTRSGIIIHICCTGERRGQAPWAPALLLRGLSEVKY